MTSPRRATEPRETFPLRERKAAQTRLALLDAATRRLATAALDDIAVKALCADVGVSEPTFFNHFGSKLDLLVFYVQLWSVEMQVQMARGEPSPFQALDRLFAWTGAAVARTPRLMVEVIAHQIRRVPPKLAPPTRAEIALRFPHVAGASKLSPRPIEALLTAPLARAVARGDLPARTDAAGAVAMLAALFFGAPAAHRDARAVRKTYAAGLRAIWRGLGGRVAEGA